MTILKLKDLEEMSPGTVFADGEFIDSEEGINIANTGNPLKWTAVRGGIPDWAIYIDDPFNIKLSFEDVRKYGNKLYSESYIKKLVPCDDEVFQMYRN